MQRSAATDLIASRGDSETRTDVNPPGSRIRGLRKGLLGPSGDIEKCVKFPVMISERTG